MRAGLKEELNEFWREYRRFAWALGLVILLVYGGRVIHDDFFLDSEIMILNPESMWYLWMGSNRFGMVATSRIFGLHRLSPWISNVLMACTMWCCGITLAFLRAGVDGEMPPLPCLYPAVSHSVRHRSGICGAVSVCFTIL